MCTSLGVIGGSKNQFELICHMCSGLGFFAVLTLRSSETTRFTHIHEDPRQGVRELMKAKSSQIFFMGLQVCASNMVSTLEARYQAIQVINLGLTILKANNLFILIKWTIWLGYFFPCKYILKNQKNMQMHVQNFKFQFFFSF